MFNMPLSMMMAMAVPLAPGTDYYRPFNFQADEEAFWEVGNLGTPLTPPTFEVANGNGRLNPAKSNFTAHTNAIGIVARGGPYSRAVIRLKGVPSGTSFKYLNFGFGSGVMAGNAGGQYWHSMLNVARGLGVQTNNAGLLAWTKNAGSSAGYTSAPAKDFITDYVTIDLQYDSGTGTISIYIDDVLFKTFTTAVGDRMLYKDVYIVQGYYASSQPTDSTLIDEVTLYPDP